MMSRIRWTCLLCCCCFPGGGAGVGWGGSLTLQSLFSMVSLTALLVQHWLCFVCCDSADVSAAQPFAFCAAAFPIVPFCSPPCCCFVLFSVLSLFFPTADPLESSASLSQRFSVTRQAVFLACVFCFGWFRRLAGVLKSRLRVVYRRRRRRRRRSETCSDLLSLTRVLFYPIFLLECNHERLSRLCDEFRPARARLAPPPCPSRAPAPPSVCFAFFTAAASTFCCFFFHPSFFPSSGRHCSGPIKPGLFPPWDWRFAGRKCRQHAA